MKRQGIHLRILIAAFLLICATTFTLDFVGVHIIRQFMLERFKDRITFLAKYLALNSEVGVLIGDTRGLKSFALNLLGEKDVARVVIEDNRNAQLVNVSRTMAGPLSMIETPVLFRKKHEKSFLFQTGERTPFGGKPLPGIETIGKVRIYFSTQGISELMGRITRQFMWVSSGLIILAGLVFFIISRSIVVEVTRFAETVKHVGRGDLEIRARPGSLPETRELAIAFNRMLDSLAQNREALRKANQEMARQKALAEVGKFSMMIAHEVKNPLGIIKSSLDILKKDLDIEPDNAMTEYMEDEISRLNGLIEEFLLFARPSKPVFRLVNFDEIVQEMVDRFALQNLESDVVFETNLPESGLEGMADPDLLTRALGNIVKNACEANNGAGVVEISTECENHTWIFEVKDEGPGLPGGDLEQVFEPFFTTKSKGTGLGLAFSSQIVGAHNGTITAKNRVDGRGAEFQVKIPIAREKEVG